MTHPSIEFERNARTAVRRALRRNRPLSTRDLLRALSTESLQCESGNPSFGSNSRDASSLEDMRMRKTGLTTESFIVLYHATKIAKASGAREVRSDHVRQAWRKWLKNQNDGRSANNGSDQQFDISFEDEVGLFERYLVYDCLMGRHRLLLWSIIDALREVKRNKAVLLYAAAVGYIFGMPFGILLANLIGSFGIVFSVLLGILGGATFTVLAATAAIIVVWSCLVVKCANLEQVESTDE